MKAKQLLMASALVVVAMTAACGDKQDTASEGAVPAPSGTATANAPESIATVTNPNVPAQADQVDAQQAAQNVSPDSDGLIRVNFDDVFATTTDGSFSLKVPVNINGVQMGAGVIFGGCIQFDGFALSQAAGHDLAVQRLPNGLVRLVKFYN